MHPSVNHFLPVKKHILYSTDLCPIISTSPLISVNLLQVAMQANVPQPNMEEEEGDDIDEVLKKLQMALEGGGGPGGWDVTEDPSIADYLQYFK